MLLCFDWLRERRLVMRIFCKFLPTFQIMQIENIFQNHSKS